jgi:hypothetical protein
MKECGGCRSPSTMRTRRPDAIVICLIFALLLMRMVVGVVGVLSEGAARPAPVRASHPALQGQRHNVRPSSKSI